MGENLEECKKKEGIFKRAFKRVKRELSKDRVGNKKLTWSLRVAVASFACLTYANTSTLIPNAYYNLTDKYHESKAEKELEKRFNLEYLGDSNEDNIWKLYYYLQGIQEINPALLEHVKKITLLSEGVCESIFVKPFNKTAGSFNYVFGNLELIHDYDMVEMAVLAHELAHVKYYYSPKEFKEKISSLFDWSKKKETGSYVLYKLGVMPTWEDGTTGPRYGFMNSIGPLSNDENIADYVETFYFNSLFLWKDVKSTDKVYQEALKSLLEEKFITQVQYDSVCDYVGFEK
ncbi:hypothetical protein HY837_05230 [archaeon]|nr:hypothetical protein [archaeon]